MGENFFRNFRRNKVTRVEITRVEITRVEITRVEIVRMLLIWSGLIVYYTH